MTWSSLGEWDTVLIYLPDITWTGRQDFKSAEANLSHRGKKCTSEDVPSSMDVGGKTVYVGKVYMWITPGRLRVSWWTGSRGVSSRSVPGGKSIRTPGGRDVSHQPSADESPALCVCVRVCLVGHYCVCMSFFIHYRQDQGDEKRLSDLDLLKDLTVKLGEFFFYFNRNGQTWIVLPQILSCVQMFCATKHFWRKSLN